MKGPQGTARLYLAGLVVLVLALLVFVQAAFNLLPFLSPSLPSHILLLYTLSTFVFLVLLIFGFILARSLFKLWIERRSEKPGARFKTRLVMSMILLTLVPATVLFPFAFGLVNRSIDKWFSAPVDAAFQMTEALGAEWSAEQARAASGVLAELAARPPEDLDRAARNLRLGALAVMAPDGTVLRQAGTGEDLDRILQRLTVGEVRAAEVSPDGDALVGVAPIPDDAGGALIGAVFRRSADLDRLTGAIAAQRASYEELKLNRRLYRDTYVSNLVLITILVLFAAVWTGLFLSKRITVPIEALSGATREISAGNLSHRVEVKADDELGLLVALFNDMAGKLQETTRELDERHRYTETVLESIPTAVISLDEEYRVTKINRAARTMFSNATPARLADIFTRENVGAIAELLRTSAEEGTITREMTIEADGRPVHCAVLASRLETGGFVLVVEDLTEVVKAQKATAWSEVARRLAHEIKNPLTPIQLSAERIARNVERAPAMDARAAGVVRECVDAIVEEVDSLKKLVNEFGRVARLPAVSVEPASLQGLVERTLALYDGALDGTRVETRFPEDMPEVMVDAQQIRRALTNLIDNALEAMAGQEDRTLTIECALVRDRTMARLTIADIGHGIAAEDRDRIFAPYFSTRKDGTGLGLAITRRIVADHGGYIGAESNGRGARFVLELPVCRES